jgi:hypothetical protein
VSETLWKHVNKKIEKKTKNKKIQEKKEEGPNWAHPS